MKNCPSALRQKILFTVLTGVGCFTIGFALYLYSDDRVTIILSGMVLLLCLLKSAAVYIIVRKCRYETVEGTCTGVREKPLRKYFTVLIVDGKGLESTLHIRKQSRVKIGHRYRFYFSDHNESRISSDIGFFNMALSSGQLLGFEEID